MKTTLKLITLLALSGSLATAAPLSTAFTYQGRLNFSNTPATGLYDFGFAAMSDSSGGAILGTPCYVEATPVTNGLFNATVDFGANVFDGTTRWVIIWVRTNSALATYSMLSPRQPITPAPYAMTAGVALQTMPGTAQTFSGTVVFNPTNSALPPFVVGNTNHVPWLNADYLDGFDSSSFVLKTGGLMSGSLYLNSTASAGLSVGQGTGTTTPPPSTGVYGVSFANGGNGVVGQADNGTQAYAIWGQSSLGYGGYFTGGNYGGYFSGGNYGIQAVSSATGYAGDFSGPARVTASFSSNPNKPQLELADASNGVARLRLSLASSVFWDMANRMDVDGNALRFYNSAANADVMVLNTNGTLSVKVLTITGGADVAEPFAMAGQEIPKGAVVIIDSQHPGQLKLSEHSYDTRVAGIVSGANGINPGLSLHQQGAFEGGQNVALSGRVYAQADATQAPINPGDLLTTSDIPGFAMKVADPGKAQGAILGKAMSPLPSGRGLVLVLVTLQ